MIKGSSPKSTFGYTLNFNTNNIIYFGGFPGVDCTIYEFSFETNEWFYVDCHGFKPSPRFNHTSIIYNSNLFVFGGENQYGNKLNDLFCLNLGIHFF
jgi:hypothetical protein